MMTPFPLQTLFSRLDCQERVPLAPFSTLKVGGPAQRLVLAHSLEDVMLVEQACRDYQIPLHILSGGSNTLFSDQGFPGVVLKLGAAFDFIAIDSTTSMRVGAATSFAKTTKMAIAQGWSHAVGWCGTPGLIGGAIRMNAGTRVGEIKDALYRVHGVFEGQAISFSHAEIGFGYRFTSLPAGFIICHAELAYDSSNIKPVEELSIKVQEYRQKRRQTQPTINSLGSFFKNPYPAFAAQLIEKCNLKGLHYRGAQISSLHANFIVNNGGASASDILYIASIAKKTVFEQFGVDLTPEVRMVGDFTGYEAFSPHSAPPR